MNFSKKRPVKIVMLGAGGTGAHIAPHLYRLLYALERPVKFIICDGDKVEPKNLVRQNFTEADLGENKARVIAERYPHIVKGRIIKEKHTVTDENRGPHGRLISTEIRETISNRMIFNILTPSGFRSLT